MGKEQELLQAVKTGDLMSTQKLLSKLKTSRNSKSWSMDLWRSDGGVFANGLKHDCVLVLIRFLGLSRSVSRPLNWFPV